MESHSKANSREDLEVDIIEGSNKTDPKFCGKEDPDATEYSSSFGETSDADNCSGFSEGEVETQFFGDIGLPPTFGSFSSTLQIRFHFFQAANIIHHIYFVIRKNHMKTIGL